MIRILKVSSDVHIFFFFWKHEIKHVKFIPTTKQLIKSTILLLYSKTLEYTIKYEL